MLFFGVGNSSSSHFDNRKNNLLILGKRPNFGINGSYGASEKKLDINFSKPNTKFVRVYIIMVIIVICLLMERKSLRLKLTIKMLTFKLNFILEVFLMDLVFWVQRMEVFTISSVDCNSMGKSDILNIHKKLMIRSNI